MSILGQKFNFIRVAASSPELRVADVDFNASQINTAMKAARDRGASIILFPELSLVGSTCADLFTQSALLKRTFDTVRALAVDTGRDGLYSIVGLPISFHGRLYNCAALLGEGKILGIVPKVYLPNRGEFYEGRWFTSGDYLAATEIIIGDQKVPFGKNLLFIAKDNPCCVLGIEICEDLWAVEPPSGGIALAGGTIILNPSASNELLGKKVYRKDLVKLQSARCLAGYVYASSGSGESSTDVVYSGHCMIAENGIFLAESERFKFDTQIIYADIDLNRLNHERLCHSSFSEGRSSQEFQYIACSNLGQCPSPEPIELLRPNSPTPFVPSDPGDRASNCREIFSIQAIGLAKRLKHLGSTRVVLGISGGLDSTLALLATARAFDVLKLERGGILAVTMPGLGTSVGTKSNAADLGRLLNVELRVIPIHAAVSQHFNDIDHDPNTFDVTFENTQARERTQILMDLANKIGGLVVGTGDLSEAALGWCTFNGDHMSMYHINIGVPKTLVRFMIEWCADEEFTGEITTVLRKICSTPISPELLPVSKDGELQQHTEELVGPYELHDYFLFQMVRHGYSPSKILYLAERAFENRYDRVTIMRWLEVFIRRFFSQQFKRSSMPDGPKVGSVALSPRGDWRMPSDASPAAWLSEIRALREEVI